jgi:hypothetical protein
MAEHAPLLNGIAPPGNSFVLPEHKMVYISVTKVACTSLRWMIADLAGEDFERFYRVSPPHQTRLMTIHAARTIWQHTPQLKDVPPEIFSEISRDNGWFIFAVVRDPWSRMWSAWQSKFLLRNAFFTEQYCERPWFPRVPQESADVLEDWAKFIAAEPWIADPSLKEDRHFLPQVISVQPDRMNYTNIYDLKNLPVLFDDIRTHLDSIGKLTPLYLPRANETPLPLIADVLDHGVADVIERAYKPDFDAFGDLWSLADLKVPDGPFTMDAIHATAYHTAANERIGDLSGELKAARTSSAEAQARAIGAERRATAAEVRAATPWGLRRARATAGKAKRRVKREIAKRHNA